MGGNGIAHAEEKFMGRGNSQVCDDHSSIQTKITLAGNHTGRHAYVAANHRMRIARAMAVAIMWVNMK